jgi:phosphoribosyl 1,2-cyclic phosphodiesterase
VKALQQFKLASWTVLPFDVEHDCVEPLGFLLANTAGDKLLFATDTFYIKYQFKMLTHILLEANYSMEILLKNIEDGITPVEIKNRLVKSHFSLENAKEFLAANDLSRVQEIHLIHVSESNSDTERFKREVQELTGKPVYIPQLERQESQ